MDAPARTAPSAPARPRLGSLLRLATLGLTLGLAAATTAVSLVALSGLLAEPARSDAAVILGNKVERSGRPSPHLRARLDRGLELYRAGTVRWLIVSGGLGVEGFQEADVMGDYLEARGVPPERVLRDPEGVTTFATAQNTRRLFAERGLESAVVVSQYFHVPRARIALRRAGVEQVSGAAARLEVGRREPYSLLRELAALPYYALRSYAPPSAPSGGGP